MQTEPPGVQVNPHSLDGEEGNNIRDSDVSTRGSDGSTILVNPLPKGSVVQDVKVVERPSLVRSSVTSRKSVRGDGSDH